MRKRRLGLRSSQLPLASLSEVRRSRAARMACAGVGRASGVWELRRPEVGVFTVVIEVRGRGGCVCLWPRGWSRTGSRGSLRAR